MNELCNGGPTHPRTTIRIPLPNDRNSARIRGMSDKKARENFRGLVEKADKNFARVRDLPCHGRDRCEPYFSKLFKVYTKLWRFQQENRLILVEAGLKRWEIGEIASRIGQLYYNQYLRTSEVRFLLESYVFYEAILNRDYFKGCSKDLSLGFKQLRFYARFLIVCLVLNRTEMIQRLVDLFKALLDDCKANFQEENFKEWKRVVQEIVRFLKVDTDFMNIKPLRYSLLFDSHPASRPHVARFHARRVLKLRDALLTSYHRNEVKFTELTLDAFRMLQCLEWEPSGSFYQMHTKESSDNGTSIDQSAVSGLIDINLLADMTDPTLPPNPRKAILYRPSVTNLISVVATICEELSPDSILLIYISASGNASGNIASSEAEISGACFNLQGHPLKDQQIPAHANFVSKTCMHCNSSLQEKGDSRDFFGGYLWLGPRGNGGLNNLYPSDIIPFTRKPLFLIIDSDSSHAFKVVHGAERGETAALLLSHGRPACRGPSAVAVDPTQNGSQFTFFLTAPLQAFCQLVGLSSNIDINAYNEADTILSSTLSEWEVMLCTSDCLDQVWARVLSDPFLRRLILRFIFCRSVLALCRSSANSCEYLPDCLPHLPDCASPSSASIQFKIHQFATSLGVANQFQFANAAVRCHSPDSPVELTEIEEES